MKLLACIIALTAALHATSALADREGAYLGIKGGGYSLNDIETRDDIDTDFGDAAWGGYAGYRFNIPLAAEIEYLVLEEDNVVFGADFEGRMFAASLKPTLDLGRYFELYAKLGWVWIDGDIQGNWRTPKVTETAVKRDEFLAGLGMAWHLGPVQLRLEYQFNEFETEYYDDAETELVTLGLAWEF